MLDFRDTFSGVIIPLFSCVILVCLCFSVLHNGDTLTFEGLLQFLSQNASSFEFATYVDYSIVGDWGLFNFLRDFLNLLMAPFSIAMYLTKLIVALIGFFFTLLKFIVG